MIPFKFFQKPKPQGNYYLSFDMDKIAIIAIGYMQNNNQSLFNNDFDLSRINIPINNCWLRITDLRTFISTQPEMIEVHYTINELNARPMHFVLRMETNELLDRINQSRYAPI